MKEMVKSQYSCYPSSAVFKMPMGRESRLISKIKPQIRIIHVYAPEIINTDAANFRELVQRLTGKSAEKENARSCKSKSPRSEDSELAIASQVNGDMEEPNKFLNLQKEERRKHGYKEIDVWRAHGTDSTKSIRGSFDGLSDFDNFVEELSDLPVFL